MGWFRQGSLVYCSLFKEVPGSKEGNCHDVFDFGPCLGHVGGAAEWVSVDQMNKQRMACNLDFWLRNLLCCFRCGAAFSSFLPPEAETQRYQEPHTGLTGMKGSLWKEGHLSTMGPFWLRLELPSLYCLWQLYIQTHRLTSANQFASLHWSTPMLTSCLGNYL